MKAIILAAGSGDRLRPYTEDRPKCLVELEGRPLIDHHLDVLRACGVEDVVLLTGYREAMLRGKGNRQYVNAEYSTTNMLWTLFGARNEIDGEVVIAYGDIVYAPSVLTALLRSRADISVVIDRDWAPYWAARFGDPLADAETLVIGKAGTIVEIGQKPKSLAEIHGQYIGLIKLSAEGARLFNQAFDAAVGSGVVGNRTPARAFMTDFLQLVADRGIPIWPVPIEGHWLEIDSPNDLGLEATRDRLRQVTQELETGQSGHAH